jgi:hypothetical protein
MESSAKLRLKLINLGYDWFVFKEFIVLLESSSKKREFFENYLKNVFFKNQKFTETYFSKGVDLYLKYFSEKDVLQECFFLLGYEELIKDNDVIKKYLILLEESIKLNNINKELADHMEQIIKVKQKRNLALIPDISNLVIFASRLQKLANEHQSIEHIQKLKGPVLTGLRENRYSDYLDFCLPLMVWVANSSDDHNFIEITLNSEHFEILFFDKYLKELEHVVKKDRKLGLLKLGNFIAYFLATLVKENRDKGNIDFIKIGIETLLITLSKKQNDRVNDVIRGNKECLTKESLAVWLKINSNVKSKWENSFLGKFTKMMKWEK